MNPIKTATFGALMGIFGTLGMAGDAVAQAAVDYRTGALVPAVMPTDQRGGWVQDAYGSFLGREPGEANGLIGLLNEQMPTDQMPTDQQPTGTDGRADLVTDAYGDVLNRPADRGSITDGTKGLNSLAGLGTTKDLFANSRPGEAGSGDGHADLVVHAGAGGAGRTLLPAVQLDGSARRGDGSVKTVDTKGVTLTQTTQVNAGTPLMVNTAPKAPGVRR